MMSGFARGLITGLVCAIGSEVSGGDKKKKTRRTPPAQVHIDRSQNFDMEAKSWCPWCKTSSAYRNSRGELVCRRCNKNHHA